METVLNFLSFNTFITQYVLIFFYYLGVFLIPFLLFRYRAKIESLANINTQNMLVKFIVFMILFFMMELILRMFFEMMIGFFDLHDYAQLIKSSVS